MSKVRIATNDLGPGEVVGLAFLMIGFVVASVLLTAFIIMLVMGGLHHEVSADIPAISFLGSILVSLALGIVGSFFRSNK